MEDTATPETGPVVASDMASVIAGFMEEAPPAPEQTPQEEVAQELVNEAEGTGEPSAEEPATEDDATEPAETEAETPEEGDPDEPQEELVTVKVAGEERQVPLSEALAGYSRLEDYKAKTAEVAQQRRELEAKATTIEADVKAHYANQLEEATNAFAQFDPVLQEARAIDWDNLKATNPAAYVQAQDAVNARLQQLDAMKRQVATARQEAQQHTAQQEQQERAARFDTTAEEIVKARPELADEAKFSEFASTNIAFLKEVGFDAEQIASSLDHRVLSLADDARQWRAQQAARASLPPKRVVTKSAVKPLTTDGSGSRATPSRPPSNATRDGKVNWVVNQLLSGD